MTKTDKRKWLEIIAVVLTGALKYILMDWLELRLFYITAACLFWSLYIFNRYRADKTVLKKWGFRKAYFRETFLLVLPFAIAIIAAVIWYGITYNSVFLNWHVIPVFFLYPAWGVIQQFLMIAIIAGNLRAITTVSLNDKQLILLISVLFSFAHFPDPFLMGFTFFMELLFLIAYFKYRNLWPLGLFHGWIGSLLLFFVMGRDLWNELWVVF
ncbi:MAG: CPBP family glutamic-type intramembrane protease [Bacteroidota bacterium]